MKKRYVASFVAVAWCTSCPLGASVPYVDFNQAPVFELPSSSMHCLAADFNNDRRPDLILGYSIDPGNVLVLLNAGDGSFVLCNSLYVAGNKPPGIAAADFNGDGNLDFGANIGASVFIFPGDGSGGFGCLAAKCQFSAPTTKRLSRTT